MTTVYVDRDRLMACARDLIEDIDVVLDVGCGIMPQRLVRPAVHICCEPYDEYLRVLQSKTAAEWDRTWVFVQATWARAVELFPPASVDTVFLVDVIEHLAKEEGRALLAATERIARRQIVVFTPLGYTPQHHEDGTDAWGLQGGAWQEHKSGWLPEDFAEDWNMLVCREFHATDVHGATLDPPVGAFWAVKTLGPAAIDTASRARADLRALVSTAADNGARFAGVARKLVQGTAAAKRTRAGRFTVELMKRITPD